MSIYNPNGDEVLHTGSRETQTYEELKKVVDDYPDFERMLLRIPDDEEE
jgi:hypothetical protein